ncbi:MAG: hypothetical protein ACYTFY_04365 [Planctomycetota bacterium]|jgi:hypothetical protein
MILIAAAGSSGMFYLAVAVVVIIMAIIVPYLLKRSRQSTKAGFVPVREQWQKRENASRMRDSADRILVELVETSREISARMDTKIRILNTLVKDAERCITRLEDLHDIPHSVKESAGGDTASAASETLPQEEGEAEHVQDNAQDPIEEVIPQDLQSLPQGPPVDISEDKSYVTEEKFQRTETDPEFENELSRRVSALLNQGYDVAEIARQVGISRQEVSLIRHLKNI